jgi:hypothetical protein
MQTYTVGYTKTFVEKVENWSKVKFPNDDASGLILRRNQVMDFCDSHDQLPNRMTFHATLSENAEIRVGVYAYAKGKSSRIFLGAVVDSGKCQVVFISLSFKRGGLQQAGLDALTDA